jgi:hypothetical protein
LTGRTRFRRPPDWLVYAGGLVLLVGVCLSVAENADAPPAPPSAGAVEAALLGPVTPFDPAVVVDAPSDDAHPQIGTAFSISGSGRWITARHVVEGCRRPALLVGGDRAVAADVRLAPHTDVALLITDGGPQALPVRIAGRLRAGQLAFHPGYPRGHPGETSSRLIGYETLGSPGRGRPGERVLAWAEVGRTQGMEGSLAGLSGAPALDARGGVVGVTVAEAPRRGRIYTTTPTDLASAVRGQTDPAPQAAGAVTIENYGRVADDLRRNLRVAQVACLSN